MKKIGIITIIDYDNYGNRLQNYATQEVLKSIGCETVTIVNSPYMKSRVFELLFKVKKANPKQTIKYFILFLKIIRYRLFKSSKEKRYIKMNEERIKSFKQFTHDNIIETDYVITQGNIPLNLGDKYDYFIVGSDQVWNPNFRGGSTIDFLTFAPINKRIAYSASFGISVLPEEYVESYKLLLSQMEYISVREKAGADIVRRLTERDVEVLVDPTLMIEKEKWLTIAKRSKHKPTNPYLLTYFLGDRSVEINEFINRIKQEYKLEVIHMADISDTLRYATDPGEFLDYINTSKIFFTDSFHGAVFSILFEKPFIITDRVSKTPSMNSRIDTLLTKFQLEDRKWENIKGKDNVFDVDFSHISQILEVERKKSLDYLRRALNIKGEI